MHPLLKKILDLPLLLQSYRILLEAKTTKLGSCDKHLVYWYGCGNVDNYVLMRSDRSVMVNLVFCSIQILQWLSFLEEIQ